jgi:hypothetical protein
MFFNKTLEIMRPANVQSFAQNWRHAATAPAEPRAQPHKSVQIYTIFAAGFTLHSWCFLTVLTPGFKACRACICAPIFKDLSATSLLLSLAAIKSG